MIITSPEEFNKGLDDLYFYFKSVTKQKRADGSKEAFLQLIDKLLKEV